MATYTGIKGVRILKVSSDPSTLIEGMMWFNTTTGVLKLRKSSTTVVISGT
tara:strand:- start:583 stop:735 length:153 start_codon:yes stop_codon:yes gene_type:complete